MEENRIVPDVTAVKALAHPVRMRMLGMLRLDGPATATQLAQRLDLNSGATSYHLRQLEQHGFIVEDSGRGNKRDRWWKAAHAYTSVDAGTDDATRDASDAFAQSVVINYTEQVQRATQERAELPDAWRQVSIASDGFVAVTPEQAAQITARLHELLGEILDQYPARLDDAPEGARHYLVHLNAFPRPGHAVEVEE